MRKAQVTALPKKLCYHSEYSKAAFVAAHAKFQKTRGRQPSLSYKTEPNPRKALKLALNDLKNYEAS